MRDRSATVVGSALGPAAVGVSELREEIMVTANTLVDLLQRQAERYGEKVAFAFSYNGDGEDESRLTFRELDVRARALAAHLQRQGATGQRVLVFCRPSLDAITGYLGCLYAGAIAVPARERVGAAMVDAIQAGLAEHHGIQAVSVVLVPPRSIPVTSSGKVQRSACRQLFLDRGLETVAEWYGPLQPAPPANSEEAHMAELMHLVLARRNAGAGGGGGNGGIG
ncbi:AMP-binding protein [Mycolicibacter icosiumassiliensis]|uniref:AMP-binding protein n=1 Tax=Mycolicibacter icosiumassiliensis TaxID=1792835 RepID=UPI00082FD7F1|nr:AMP-binding protein [Mycolicibacter icosiumassiliensis]